MTTSGDFVYKWALDGFRIGMPQEEALTLFEGSVDGNVGGNSRRFRLKVEQSFIGILEFDGENRLTKWDALYSSKDLDQVRELLITAFGAPDFTEVVECLTSKGSPFERELRVWSDMASGVSVVLKGLRPLVPVEGREMSFGAAAILRIKDLDQEIADWRSKDNPGP